MRSFVRSPLRSSSVAALLAVVAGCASAPAQQPAADPKRGADCAPAPANTGDRGFDVNLGFQRCTPDGRWRFRQLPGHEGVFIIVHVDARGAESVALEDDGTEAYFAVTPFDWFESIHTVPHEPEPSLAFLHHVGGAYRQVFYAHWDGVKAVIEDGPAEEMVFE